MEPSGLCPGLKSTLNMYVSSVTAAAALDGRVPCQGNVQGTDSDSSHYLPLSSAP